MTYILISWGEHGPRKLDRPSAALLGAVLMVMSGSLTRAEAAAAMDIHTIGVLFGMMLLVVILMQSGLPTQLAFRVLHRTTSPRKLLAIVVFTAGFASAAVLNDTVCLLGTPVILEITDQAGMSEIPFLLALATSANIGSVMTLTGNPQNIIIGHASGWSWSGFALRMVPVGVICLGLNWLILSLFYGRLFKQMKIRRDRTSSPPAVNRDSAVKGTIMLIGLVAVFCIGAPMDFAAVAAGTLLLVWIRRPTREAREAIDWSLLLFFAGLFVVVEGFVRVEGHLIDGWVQALGTNVNSLSIAQISIGTLIGSNIFSNVPFVLIISHWVRQMSDPRFVWLVLALTSTFAGNLTLLGSVANVIVAQSARHKVSVGFSDFLRLGVPITLATTAVGVMLLWTFWQWGWV